MKAARNLAGRPCPSCQGALTPVTGVDAWRCADCGLLAVRPPEAGVALSRLGVSPGPGELTLQPRGTCPGCDEDLRPLDHEPWSMCPRCRLRLVPRQVLPRLARAPELISRTPLGVASDGLQETSLNRGVRLAVAALLAFGSILIFQHPGEALEQCGKLLDDPSLSFYSRQRGCENWFWFDLVSLWGLGAAGWLVFSALRSRPSQTEAAAHEPPG